jgi:hypothetical protein
MVCGNQQTEDIVSHLFYSAVVYSSTLRVIYTFIAIYDLEIEAFDIVVVYFNVDVFEDVIIYMR